MLTFMFVLSYVCTAVEPKIKNYKRHVHIGEGEELTLKVEFSGLPKPTIDWFYDGMRLDAESLGGREILNDGSIHICAVEGVHAGTYDFIVSNSLGSVEGCTKLIVYVEEKERMTLDRKKKNGEKLESHPVKRERFGDYVSHCHTFNNKVFSAEYQVRTNTHMHIHVHTHTLTHTYTHTHTHNTHTKIFLCDVHAFGCCSP